MKTSHVEEVHIVQHPGSMVFSSRPRDVPLQLVGRRADGADVWRGTLASVLRTQIRDRELLRRSPRYFR
jgi:hypothetical protein